MKTWTKILIALLVIILVFIFTGAFARILVELGITPKRENNNLDAQIQRINENDENTNDIDVNDFRVGTEGEGEYNLEESTCPEDRRPKNGACDDGFKAKMNANNELCCYIDESVYGPTDEEIFQEQLEAGAELGKGIVAGTALEYGLSQVAQRALGQEARKKGEREAVKKAAKNTAKKASKKAAKEAIQKKVKNIGKTIGKMKGALRAIAKGGVKAPLKLFTKVGAKQAAKQLGQRMALKLVAGGGIGTALLVWDLINIGLDMWDPMGLGSFIPLDEQIKNRNIMEATLQETQINDGDTYPALIPYAYKLSEEETEQYMEMFTNSSDFEDVIKKITDEATTLADEEFQLKYDKQIDERVEQKLTELGLDPLEDEEEYKKKSTELYTEYKSEIYPSLLEPNIENGFSNLPPETMDKILCKTFNWFQQSWDVEYVDGIGCTLREDSCAAYNEYNYSKPPQQQGSYGMYSKYYRVNETPNTPKQPKMKTKVIPNNSKICQKSYLSKEERQCRGKPYVTVDENGNVVQKNDLVPMGDWNNDKGLCSYSTYHCELKGRKIQSHSSGANDCVKRDGQEECELVGGEQFCAMTAGGIANIDASMDERKGFIANTLGVAIRNLFG